MSIIFNIIIVANKIDKLRKIATEKNISAIKEKLPQILIFPYSAKTKKGKDKLIEKIASFV